MSAQVLYKGSEELLEIIESVKAMPYVKNVDWSETVKVVGNNNIGMLKDYSILDSKSLENLTIWILGLQIDKSEFFIADQVN